MLTVPFIGFLAGYGWASFGIMVAALLKSIDNFSYVTSTVITPLFLVAGTFFPISNLPAGWRIAANLNPLYHTVELVRHAVFGFRGWVDVWHLAFLVGFGLLMWRLAIRFMERKLID
jgi:lipooligosaccharide transport system permease protein